MKKNDNSNNPDFSRLRADAEKVLSSLNVNDQAFAGQVMKLIFQELQVHQIELEMQNDELQTINTELEMQRLKFAGIYDFAPIGYLILDDIGIIVEANPAAVKLLGVSKRFVTNHRLQGFVTVDYKTVFSYFYNRLLTTPDRQSCQLKLTSSAGNEFYALMEGIYVQASAQCYVTITDITESIKARQILAETKDRLQMAMEASSAGTWELHLNFLTFNFDEYFYRLCGINKDEFESTYVGFIELIHPDDRFAADQHFRTAINNEKEVDLVCRLITREEKTCYISMRGHIVHKTETEKSFIGIALDITEKKLLEEEAAMRKDIRQKEIAAAVLIAEENERRRISEALHDSVSQLLYGIRLQLNEFSEQKNDPAMVRLNQLLNMAVRETRNISFELAPSILTDFGLKATIEELVKRLSTPQLQIKLHVTGLDERLEANLETNIFRIIQELINNCFKHAEATEIRISLKKSKQLEIIVIDNGKGFDSSKHDNRPKGAGFSSIKNRLSLYAGHLNITSEPGKGTMVHITLSI